MRIFIVIPTYNEAENLPKMVPTLLSLGINDLHILVVDDNSPDSTGAVAEDLAKQYPGQVEVIHRPGKMGLGTAYLTGFRRALMAGADYIFAMDADFSHSPQDVPRLLERIQDYDVVVGSRYVAGGHVDPRWSFWRKLLSWGGNLYARWVTGLRVKDTTAGFKCFRREALLGLNLDRVRSDGYAFQVEMAYACQRKGYKVAEIPITFLERSAGQSKMSWGIVLEAIGRVWQLRWRY